MDWWRANRRVDWQKGEWKGNWWKGELKDRLMEGWIETDQLKGGLIDTLKGRRLKTGQFDQRVGWCRWWNDRWLGIGGRVMEYGIIQYLQRWMQSAKATTVNENTHMPQWRLWQNYHSLWKWNTRCIFYCPFHQNIGKVSLSCIQLQLRHHTNIPIVSTGLTQ